MKERLVKQMKEKQGVTEKLKEEDQMMIFCNPHNPVGKIWDRETLAHVGELAKKYHVIVVSDEIHCDITDPDKEYIKSSSWSEAVT